MRPPKTSPFLHPGWVIGKATLAAGPIPEETLGWGATVYQPWSEPTAGGTMGGMNKQPQELKAMAQDLLAGRIGLEAFVQSCSTPSSAELGDVTLDMDRHRRCGFPEVVYGEGKPTETLAKIVAHLAAKRTRVLVTRVDSPKGGQLVTAFPGGVYNETGRTFRVDPVDDDTTTTGRVVLITAGTSDLPVAEEARETIDWMGVEVTMIHDVGVAGPHRLPAQVDKLRGADAVVVVAGQEGALPSVVGGYVDCPVVAVPTSIGYGASFGGLAALLGMLNSCAANVTVVNIDAGFKGGYIAGLIAHRRGDRLRESSESLRKPQQT